MGNVLDLRGQEEVDQARFTCLLGTFGEHQRRRLEPPASQDEEVQTKKPFAVDQ